MTYRDRTRYLFFLIVGLALLAIIVSQVIRIIGDNRDTGGSESGAPSGTMTGTASEQASDTARTPDEGAQGGLLGEGDILIEIWTNDTKATWVHMVTEMFNQRGYTIEDGRTITVQVEQRDSGDFPIEIQALHDETENGPTIISPGTIAWVNAAGGRWQDLKGQPLVTGECPTLAYAPIGFGMWQSMAEVMGWPDTPIGWGEIVDLAADPEGWARYGHPEWGQFKFGHTDPNSSNTGLAAMTSFVYAALDRMEGLTPELARSPEVVAAFEKLELNTYHYGSSTKSLNIATAIRGKAYLHAVASSENSILATNYYQGIKAGLMEESLVFIFPKEGVFWSENPFCVVNAPWVTDAQKEAAGVYREFLLSQEAQQHTVEGWLRPVNLDHMPEILPEEWQYTDSSITIEDIPPLETDASGDTAAAVQDVFNQAKKKATIIVVLDRSQSMDEGGKLAAAKEATNDFLDALDRDDKVQVYLFDDVVTPLQPLAPAGTVIETLKGQIEGIWAEGNTALFDAVCQAKETAETAKAEDEAAGEKRLYGIVLLSDGEDTNSGRSESEMFSICVPRSESADVVKIFTIAYGEDADETLLERIANRTNGKAYVADPESISEVLQEIVWEQ